MHTIEARAMLEEKLRAATSPWERLPLLIELSKEPTHNDPEYGHQRALEALALAWELKDQFWIARSLRELGLRSAGKARFSETLDYLRRASGIFMRINHRRLVAETDLPIARVLIWTGKFTGTMELLMKRLAFFEGVENPYWIARGASLSRRNPPCARRLRSGRRMLSQSPDAHVGLGARPGNRLHLRGLGAPLLVDMKVCAVDDMWSGLKLMRRKK